MNIDFDPGAAIIPTTPTPPVGPPGLNIGGPIAPPSPNPINNEVTNNNSSQQSLLTTPGLRKKLGIDFSDSAVQSASAASAAAAAAQSGDIGGPVTLTPEQQAAADAAKKAEEEAAAAAAAAAAAGNGSQGSNSSGGTSTASAQNFNTVTDPTLGGLGNQQQLAAAGGAVGTGNTPDGQLVVKTADGSTWVMDMTTGNLTPWTGSVQNAAQAQANAAANASAPASTAAASGGAGATGGTGSYTAGTAPNGSTLYSADDPATQNVAQGIHGQGTAESMYNDGNGNWVVKMSNGTVWSVKQNGGPNGVTQLSSEPTTPVTGGGGKPPKVNTAVMPAPGTPASAIGAGGNPTNTGVPTTVPNSGGPGRPADRGPLAPTGVVGPVDNTWTNPQTGVKYWVMADGRVYSQGTTGGVRNLGDYGTPQEALTRVKDQEREKRRT